MKFNTGQGCLLFIILIIVALIPFKFIIDLMEEKDRCYEFIPFCDSIAEKGHNEKEKIRWKVYSKVEDLAINTSPKKWHTVTEYKSDSGGYIYYLGTNSVNGIYLYWNGDISNLKLWALDFQARDELKLDIYEYKEGNLLKEEFLESEEAQPLIDATSKFINY